MNLSDMWLILGSGVSGKSAANLLRSFKKQVFIFDDKLSPSKHESFMTQLTLDESLKFLEEKRPSIVISPGISLKHLLAQKAIHLELDIYSEPDFSSLFFKGSVLGVTGTNGKSTTTAMIHHLLKFFGVPSHPCGNFGIPLSQLILDSEKKDFVAVMELSSFQLEQSYRIRLDSGVFFNFSQDHIDRHPTEKDYFSAKWRLRSFLKEQGQILVSPEIRAKAHNFHLPLNQVTVLSPDKDFLEETSFLPPHNQENAFYGINLLLSTKLLPSSLVSSDLIRALKDFSGLPHRLEHIGTFLGQPVINDSKATNVASTITALKSMKEPVYCALGGYDKQESFTPILQYQDKILGIFPFGSTGPRIAQELPMAHKPFSTLKALCEYWKTKDWQERPKGAFLFSPGCSSFDEFQNFEHRGIFLREFWKESKIL